MGNLDPLLAGVKRLAQDGVLLPVASPPAIVVNATGGLTFTNNAATGQVDLSASGITTFPWTTAADIDLTAQGSQTFSSDTNYTFAGLTWTKKNTANESVNAAISSSGLNFQPGPSSYYLNASGSSSRSLPLLWTPLSGILPAAFDWSYSLRIWVAVGAESGISGDPFGGVGCDDNGAGTAVNGYILVRGNNGSAWSNQSIGTWATMNGQNTSTNRNANGGMTLGVANRVMVLEIPGLSSFNSRGYFASNASQPTWPATNTLNFCTFFTGGVTSESSGPVAEPPTNMGIFLGCAGAGSGGSPSMTFTRVRVDYRP